VWGGMSPPFAGKDPLNYETRGLDRTEMGRQTAVEAFTFRRHGLIRGGSKTYLEKNLLEKKKRMQRGGG